MEIKFNIGEEIERFIQDGKLVIGICNGFQSLVNLGLVPGFDGDYQERRAALTYNDSGNFIDTWVNLKVNSDSPCIFTKGISTLELPVRHGEGKFYATAKDIDLLFENRQVTLHQRRSKTCRNRFHRLNQPSRYQVPISQDARYCFCSAVSRSMDTPIDLSLRAAMASSIFSGTT